jgi:hypothetical protein
MTSKWLSIRFKPSRGELLANCEAFVYFAASNLPRPRDGSRELSFT